MLLRERGRTFLAALVLILFAGLRVHAGETTTTPGMGSLSNSFIPDTQKVGVPPALHPEQESSHNIWGLDILISNDGFGMGGFYRREFTEDIVGFVSFSISESKDSREFERFDYFGNSYVPGKLNRFLVLPLMIGIQYRLFREDIADNFRPYINAGAGPTMIYAMPYVNIISDPSGGPPQSNEVEFFKALGKGQPHYTAGAFIGFGANFGSEKSNAIGVNFRYYFTYLFSDGLPSLYNQSTGEVSANKKDFGGFFITLNFGFVY